MSSTSEGGVCVCSKFTATYYPAQGWTSKFSRHLHAGFFDSPALAHAPEPEPERQAA